VTAAHPDTGIHILSAARYSDRVKEATMAPRAVWLAVLLCIGISGAAFGLDHTFGEAGLGYTIDYPTGWVVERPSQYTVLFAGAPGTSASMISLTIQNVATTAIGGVFASAADLLNNLKCQLVSGAGDICIYVGEAITVVDAAGRRLVGPQMIAEYAYDGDIYKEWVAVVPHNSGDVLYVLSYTALRSDYDRHEPTILDMVATWTIGGTVGGSSTTPASSAGTTNGSGDIVIVLEDSGHIGPYNYTTSSYDKRYYDVTIPSHGYLAIAVIDEAGESISGWVYTPAGLLLMQKMGNFAEIYTSSYEVFPGTYEIKVGQDTMVTESNFRLTVYFSTTEFTVADLEAAFGTRYQTLP
jgi:hypothetical protein